MAPSPLLLRHSLLPVYHSDGLKAEGKFGVVWCGVVCISDNNLLSLVRIIANF